MFIAYIVIMVLMHWGVLIPIVVYVGRKNKCNRCGKSKGADTAVKMDKEEENVTVQKIADDQDKKERKEPAKHSILLWLGVGTYVALAFAFVFVMLVMIAVPQ